MEAQVSDVDSVAEIQSRAEYPLDAGTELRDVNSVRSSGASVRSMSRDALEGDGVGHVGVVLDDAAVDLDDAAPWAELPRDAVTCRRERGPEGEPDGSDGPGR